jgi:hypothetical protein
MQVGLCTVVTVAPGLEAGDGSVIVLRNGVNDGCDQARPHQPMNKNRNARGWRTQLMRTPSKEKLSRWHPLVYGGFLLAAEARIHFRSYKSAEFLFRGGKTRLLINKLGLDRDQVDKLRNLFKRAKERALYQNMRILVNGRFRRFRSCRRSAILPSAWSCQVSKIVQDCVAAYFQPSLRDLITFDDVPRTTVLR